MLGSIFRIPVDPDELPASSKIGSPRSVQKRQNRDKMGDTTIFCSHGQDAIFWSMGGHFLGKNIFQKLFPSFLTRKTRRAASKSVSKLKDWWTMSGLGGPPNIHPPKKHVHILLFWGRRTTFGETTLLF